MALFDNGFKLGTGLAVGIGALILIPVVLPVVAEIIRPLVKATIKGGMILIEKGQELAAETKEAIEDLTAEAKAELTQERARAGLAAEDGLHVPPAEGTV